MSEESMIERVARAINPTAFMMGAAQQRYAMQTARSAIVAMREPTKGMMAIVSAEHDFRDASIYRPFIDAALKEGK